MIFQLGTKVTGYTLERGMVNLKCEADGKPLSLKGDKVLVCVGRRPFTKGLGIEELGILPDAKTGQISVDANYQTKVPGVFALGDLVAGPMSD